MKVRDVMTKQVIPVGAKETVAVAARSLTHYNIGALPVVENGRLCGIVSLGDLTKTEENAIDAADALTEITANIQAE